LVLTNYHVLSDIIEKRIEPDEVGFRFDFRVLPTGLRSPGTLLFLAVNWLIDFSKSTDGELVNDPDATLPTSDELDYALVRINREIGEERILKESSESTLRGWINIPSAKPAIVIGMPVLIVQHQKAEPLTLAIDTHGVIGLNDNKTRV